MIVKLEDSSGIDWVKAKIEHDAGFDEVSLRLTEEENTYFGIWKVHSTHSKTYQTIFTARNNKGEQNSITLAWSDACSPPNGGNWTLDGNCTISGVNGVDNGNFTVDGGYTLTIQNGATFAWNSGKSITITNGSIVINAGGQSKQTNLWMTDADGDTYALSGASQYAQDSTPANCVRRNTIIQGKYDCDDNNASIYPGAVCRATTGGCDVAEICQDSGSCPADVRLTTVTFTYKGASVTYGTVEHNGECWMDRNLGASQVATAYNDSAAYGDLFQWGRLDDGHQTCTSNTTTTLSSTDNPGHSNFIYGGGSLLSDWRSPQNNNLWQGVSGTNNPCPSGWRLPTYAEWDAERASWSQQNYNGAFASPLKLTAAGIRESQYAWLATVGSWGYYWSSTVVGADAYYVIFSSTEALTTGHIRAYGISVRCVRD